MLDPGPRPRQEWRAQLAQVRAINLALGGTESTNGKTEEA